MSLKYKHTLLLVDDEESIAKSLQRIFRKEGYEIYTALNGQEGLKRLKETGKAFSLIVSDQRMPGMTGAQFLEKAKEIFPHAIRILLTGYSDMDAIVDAVNKGEIHRYLTKPWNDDDLLLQVRQALEQYELVVENRRLLALTKRQNKKLRDLNKDLEKKVDERTLEIKQKNRKLEEINEKLEKGFLGTIRLLSPLVESLNPMLGKYMIQVASLARHVAEEYKLDKKELDQIEIAAMIHDIGLLGLPEGILKKDEKVMSEKEFGLYSQHPAIGQVFLQFVESMDPVGAIILSHHEHYDGGGFPNGLIGEEIPLGARIIGVVADYCKIVSIWPNDFTRFASIAQKYIREMRKDIVITDPKEMRQDVAAKIIRLGASEKYDPNVVTNLMKKLGKSQLEMKEVKEQIVSVHFEELKEGMVVAKNICAKNGAFLVPSGTALKKHSISALRRLGQGKVIDEQIYVTV